MSLWKPKELAALVSVASALVTVIAGAAALEKTGWLSDTLTLKAMYVALVGAFFASVVSLLVTRSLRLHRRPRSVFFVYSRKDLQVAKELSAKLAEAGFAPWLDVEQLVPGQVWRRQIVKAIQEAGVAVVLVSEHFVASKESQAELAAAMKILTAKDKSTFPVLPVRLDDSPVPSDLAHVQWVTWSEPDSMKKLLRGLSYATGVPLSTGKDPRPDSAA